MCPAKVVQEGEKIILAPGTLDDNRLRAMHRHFAAEFPPCSNVALSWEVGQRPAPGP